MTTRRPYRHTFRFKVETTDGEKKIITCKALVRKATKPVMLTLTADDVRRSKSLKGVGNTQTCSMAVCAKRQAHNFPHPVEGYIDWQYSRAYVVSKISKVTGFPSECVAYIHHDDIAKMNDSKGGQDKLLNKLESAGSCDIHLLPISKRKPSRPGVPEGRKDGSRSGKVYASGARLRFAVAQLGGFAD